MSMRAGGPFSRAGGPLSLLAVVAASLALAPAAAQATAGNAAATHAYLQANYALVRVARAHLAASEAEPLRVLAQVRQECPQAGAGSPQNTESTQVSDEIIGAIVIAAAQPDVQAIETFIHAVSGLHWSSGAATSAVRAYAGDLKTVLGLGTPNLCADVKAWAAGGYRTLPASIAGFSSKFMPAWVALGYLPKQLAAFESAADRALARRCEPLEELLTEGETRAVAHYGDIMNALEISP
jgi:hypothetical protein